MFANTALVRTECLQTFPLVRGCIFVLHNYYEQKKSAQAGLNTRPHGIIEHNTTHTTTKPKHHKI